MIKASAYFIFAAGIFLIASCASPYRSLARSSSIKAAELKSACQQKHIASSRIVGADSACAAGMELIEKGKPEEGCRALDLACLRYRLALSGWELERTNNEIIELRKSLEEAALKVKIYNNFINQSLQ